MRVTVVTLPTDIREAPPSTRNRTLIIPKSVAMATSAQAQHTAPRVLDAELKGEIALAIGDHPDLMGDSVNRPPGIAAIVENTSTTIADIRISMATTSMTTHEPTDPMSMADMVMIINALCSNTSGITQVADTRKYHHTNTSIINLHRIMNA